MARQVPEIPSRGREKNQGAVIPHIKRQRRNCTMQLSLRVMVCQARILRCTLSSTRKQLQNHVLVDHNELSHESRVAL